MTPCFPAGAAKYRQARRSIIRIKIKSDAPDTKYITAQEPMIRAAWPKSGCKASKIAIENAMIKEISLPGGPFKSKLDFITHPLKIMKHGFKNSDGCNETDAKENHLTAPLP